MAVGLPVGLNQCLHSAVSPAIGLVCIQVGCPSGFSSFKSALIRARRPIDARDLSRCFPLPAAATRSGSASLALSLSLCINPSVICHSTPPERGINIIHLPLPNAVLIVTQTHELLQSSLRSAVLRKHFPLIRRVRGVACAFQSVTLGLLAVRSSSGLIGGSGWFCHLHGASCLHQ